MPLAECRCESNFTCGYCLWNAKPYHFTPRSIGEIMAEQAKPKNFITTTQGMSGFFAVMYWWNDKDIPGMGFWEPWDTGIGRYGDEARAIEEAQDWAESEGLEYVPREKPPA